MISAYSLLLHFYITKQIKQLFITISNYTCYILLGRWIFKVDKFVSTDTAQPYCCMPVLTLWIRPRLAFIIPNIHLEYSNKGTLHFMILKAV